MMNHLEHGEKPGRERRFVLLPRNSPLGWTPYAWLVYLLMFLLEPTLRQRPAWEALLTYAGAAVFLVAYFRAFWARGREHAHGGGVHVAEQHALDAALHERDPAASGADMI